VNALLKSAGVLLAASVGVVVAAIPATAATGSTLSPNNSCANPVLAQNATGWSVSSGGTGSRVSISDHAAARYAYRVTASSTAATMTLPAPAVSAGQKLTFAADSQINSGGRVTMVVDFYSRYLRVAHVTGTAVKAGSATWSRASLSTTVPSGAVRAVVSQSATLTRGAQWSSTACDYAPTASTPPTSPPTTSPTTTTTVPPTTTTTPPPTTTPAGPGDGTQAATALGWGTPVDGDEFEGTSLNTAKWAPYNSPGHNNKGLRRPSQIAVANGVMTMTGTADGTTGGMEFKPGRLYGRWETRMQVPKGDSRYHPVVLLWPDKEDWPTGGEVDYAEMTCASTSADFFLHYSASNQQTQASTKLDITQWHNYAVEWTSTGIRGYIDGVLTFTDTNKAHLPPRSMHQTMQLDWFPNGSTPTTPSSMNVAWSRYYAV
jgi:Glycosyl hydrolases family 16